MTLKQLSYFLALAQERHFGRAAARVHVTQPALSMQVRELEDRLGTPLLERGRDLRLTPAGREVAARAARILAEVAEIDAMARRRSLGGRVNVGIIPTVAPYLLPRLLPRVTTELRLREAQTEALLDGLEDGSLDAVVIASPARHGMVAHHLFTDRFLLAGSESRLAALAGGIEHLRPSALDPDHLLLLDEGHCLADQALEVCGLDRRQARLDLGASSLSTLAGLVGQGYGLTFLPEIAAPLETAAQPAMRLARFAEPQPAREVALVGRASTAAEPWFETLAHQIREIA
ncbi:LysR substrate-binding domain-containing protein [Cereibacter sp. SYSU M97828]|nr:LysR substrate-binding domain-containing protein [Cereibacter flavus]